MKKLMIAVAMVAMVGGVEAASLAYDFTANLKTTKSKSASKSTKSYTVNVGTNESGEFWWEALGYANDDEAKKAVSAMDETERADVAESLGFDGKVTDYSQKITYRGKKQWCYTFKFKQTSAGCYRVASTLKLKGRFVADGCCGLAFVPDNEEAEDIGSLDFVAINRFGGVMREKSTKVEAFGTLGGDVADGETPGRFSFAGQGTWKDRLIRIDGEDEGGVSNLSGSIVGTLAAPTCETCCGTPDDACAFTCDGEEDDSLPTYAYGTFTLKFNASASKRLN